MPEVSDLPVEAFKVARCEFVWRLGQAVTDTSQQRLSIQELFFPGRLIRLGDHGEVELLMRNFFQRSTVTCEREVRDCLVLLCESETEIHKHTYQVQEHQDFLF